MKKNLILHLKVVLIFENLSFKFLNISGYKALNGSQILRENITYIINTIKSIVDKNEQKKTIIHIFNSKFILDKKKLIIFLSDCLVISTRMNYRSH